MKAMLDISEVARRTGLSARALRFYEARGLVEPVRTASGRRAYGLAELERITQITALKRAGLKLAQIQQLLATRPPDLSRLVDAQMTALVVRRQQITDALELLVTAAGRLRKGEALDLATLCELIRTAESKDELNRRKQEAASWLLSEDRAKTGAERMWAVLSRIDPDEYRRQCVDLYARIEAALPLELDSPRAQAFLEEWQALQAPLMAIGCSDPLPPAPAPDDLLSAIDRWQAAAKADCPAEVWPFLFALARDHDRNSGRQ